jgi:PAS domain S-box-containing protein
MSKTRILVVDDDLGVLQSLEAILVQSGFQVSAVGTVPEALELVSNHTFDVLLADLNIGQPGDGFTVVSAMRRVQPNACTFILTGYPDIESAIRAIRSQVDDYFAKPLRIDELLSAISAVRSGKKRPAQVPPTKGIAELLRNLLPEICDRWYHEVMQEPELAAIPLTKEERVDHVPELLAELILRVEQGSEQLSSAGTESARKHGRFRYQQGYAVPQVLFEARVLQKVISLVIQENLMSIELSTLVHDILAIGESLQAEVEISIRTHQTQVPPSLQTSFSMLYKSPFLGVAIAEENRIVDANDAFLRMIGCTRDQLNGGEIDWFKMTPEKFRPLDEAGLDQLREFGTCAPYEKEFTLPNGTSLPFLIGAVRLSLEPLRWSSYIVNLTEQRTLQTAEQKLREWESRSSLINQLAHELNNPLAALLFTTHLLSTHPDLTDDMAKLLADATEMQDRITATVRKVLVESHQ